MVTHSRISALQLTQVTEVLKGTSVMVLRAERALDIHAPHLQFLPARDSNSQPFDDEFDSLTIDHITFFMRMEEFIR